MKVTFAIFILASSISDIKSLSSSIVATKSDLLSHLSQPTFKTNRIIQLVSEMELSQREGLVFPELNEKLRGQWILKYSNNFYATPSYDRISVFKLDSVIQNIDLLNNVIEHELKFSGLITCTITLQHLAKIVSKQSPALISISLDKIKASGPLGSATLPLDVLIRPDLLRTGFFETTYVDEDLRVSRGLSGELRVFSRKTDSTI